jgi:hypothetical protein
VSKTLDPNMPLPPVDEDSDLVGKNNRLGKSDDDEPNSAEAPGVTLPIAGGGAYPLPGVRFVDELEEAVGEEDDTK